MQVFGPDQALIGGWTAPGTTLDDGICGISVSVDGVVYVSSP